MTTETPNSVSELLDPGKQFAGKAVLITGAATGIGRATGGSCAAKAGYAAAEPEGRLGRPEEIAAAVLYLASPLAAFTTGSELVVDGGW